MYPPRVADPKSLVIASLAIYLFLLQPVTYCLWKHGKQGILGWIALHSLCVIRIVGNAVQLNAYNNHSTGGIATLILQSVGLSPLILAAVGILHEASVHPLLYLALPNIIVGDVPAIPTSTRNWSGFLSYNTTSLSF